jgi:hypothetical protein
MSMKVLLAACAAACMAAAESFATAAEEVEGGGAAAPAANKGKAPAPKPAVQPGAATGKGGAKPAAPGKGKKKEPEVDFDSLKNKLLQVVSDLGKEKATSVLKRFGVEKLGELDTNQYDDMSTYLDQVIAGEVDPDNENAGDGSEDLF